MKRDGLFDSQGHVVRLYRHGRFGGCEAQSSARCLDCLTPLISILAILWLWHETSDVERIADHAQATFWYVLPTLPMFLVFPTLLRHGVIFWLAFAISCGLTTALYLLMIWVLRRFGISL
jgi:hypothetical protein